LYAIFFMQRWGYAFVEIHDLETDAWTTLPDLNGLTAQDTGQSCISVWIDGIHPHLANSIDPDCNPSGTSGQ
jgi:hypothetical protein